MEAFSLGMRLTPSHAINKGQRYRYYVSAALITEAGTDRAQSRRMVARVLGTRPEWLSKRRHRALSSLTDTCGLLVGAEVHPADVQDRDGAVLVIEAIHQLFPWLRHLFADSVYNGPNLREALAKFGKWTIEIVKRAADAAGFQLLPRRWVVERTLAWLNRNRRLAKDFEASIASAKAWVYIASVQLLIRRLA